MARRVRIEWNIDAFQEIRRLPEVEAALQEQVDRILADVATGKYADGYEGGVEDGKSRSRGYVLTKSYDAMLREHWDHALLKALGSGS